MDALVWVDEWQLMCCGDPFEVGSAVSWNVHPEVDTEWLASVLGPERAAEVTHAEEHHGDLEQLPVVAGTVRAIELVYCEFASNGRVQLPVPGSAVLTPVAAVNGSEERRKGLSLVGYLVSLDVSPST